MTSASGVRKLTENSESFEPAVHEQVTPLRVGSTASSIFT